MIDKHAAQLSGYSAGGLLGGSPSKDSSVDRAALNDRRTLGVDHAIGAAIATRNRIFTGNAICPGIGSADPGNAICPGIGGAHPGIGGASPGIDPGVGSAHTGLTAQAANQTRKRCNRTREVRRRLIGMQVRPVHHEGSRGKRADGKRIVGTGDLDIKQAVIAHHTTRAAAGNTAGQPRLVHDLDGQVLEQVGELRMAHAILELGARVAQAHMLGDGRRQIVHAGGRLNVLGRHEGHAGIHEHAGGQLLGSNRDLEDIEQIGHGPTFLIGARTALIDYIEARLLPALGSRPTDDASTSYSPRSG